MAAANVTHANNVTDPAPRFDDPALLPFLPMLYVAWADGDLSRVECEELDRRLDAEHRALLTPLLDPDAPPTACELARLLVRLRSETKDLGRGARLTLAGLGLELAQADREVSETERHALVELEDVLGIAGSEAARQLLATRHPASVPRPVAPSFETAALTGWLDGEYRELRESLRGLLRDPRFNYRRELDKESYREQVLEWCRILAEEGYGALSFPTEQGGADDTGSFIAAFETLATHDLSLLVKFGVQFGLFGGSILNLGTSGHHARYLPATGSLELPGCFAMTETSHGSNVQDLETTADWDPEQGELVIHTPHVGARKDYIGNAARHGRMATVFAQLRVGEEEHGVHAILVPIRDDEGVALPGVTLEDCGAKLGLNGVDNGRLSFDHVRVPRQNLLDRFGHITAEGAYESPIASPSKRFFTMLGTLVGGRVSVSLGGLSAAKSALTIAIGYGAARRQFGPAEASEITLLDYPTHQRRLLPRLATTYALHCALDDLRREYVATLGGDADRREVEALAAGLKAYATDHATDTIQTCRECCGGQGYLAVNRFADLKADTEVFTTFEGDNTVLLQLVAKSLLSGYKRQFGQMGAWGLVRYVAGRAATAVSELNPVATRRSDPEHLRDPEFHSAAFAWREQHLLSTVARRLKARLDDGVEMSEALLACQLHLVTLAEAHVEARIYESFRAAIGRAAESGELGEAEIAMLETLRDLFALSRLRADRGFFLAQGYFEAVKSSAIRRQVEELCATVRGDAEALVKAFAIPRELLAAPIAG